MEDLLPSWVGQFSQYGVLGLVCLYLIWQNLKLQKTKDELQDLRVKEGRESMDAMRAATEAIKNLADKVEPRRSGR